MSMAKKIILVTIVLIIVGISLGAIIDVFKSKAITNSQTPKLLNSEPIHYTCGMHPDVRVTPAEYKKGKTTCPICNMNLTPVYADNEQRTTNNEQQYYGCGVDTEGECPHCDLGKPDEECICGQHSFAIEGAKIDCPVCGKPLKELTQKEVDKLKGVVARVKIKGEQVRLAGIKTEPVKKHELYKEIRTVGRVAYDPELAVAQEEFISSLDAFDQIKEGNIVEIKERAEKLTQASKNKLVLLGLSGEQIKELETTRKVETSLILPAERMWVYGDIYEYELSWLRQGEKVKVTTASLPGREFEGVVSSVNPVLNPKTRSVRFRLEVDNPTLELKPEMYVDIVIRSTYIAPDGSSDVLAVPKEAVLDTGMRTLVYVDAGEEGFVGRSVKLGPEATSLIDGENVRMYPVLSGLEEGEIIVRKGNFLIDSQSQLVGGMSALWGGAQEIETEHKH